jgi:hypothetical protein
MAGLWASPEKRGRERGEPGREKEEESDEVAIFFSKIY